MTEEALRVDKWLWHARFFKSRSLASKFAESRRLRINGTVIAKASRGVRPDDVLTFPLGPHIRVIRVAALGTRRGPAPEARSLYEDLAPPEHQAKPAPASAARTPGSGRPTKADRRALERLRSAE